jgi:hypothetical protein
MEERSFTIEDICRMAGQTDKRWCEKMAREGDRTVAFYIGQFKMEEARPAGGAFRQGPKTSLKA